MTVEAGKLNHKVYVWGKVEYTNALGKTDTRDDMLKHIWCNIIPQTNNMQKRPADTMLVNCTHKIICRYASAKMIKNDMHLMYKGRRFDIKYVSDPYFDDTQIDIWVEELVE